MQVSLLTNAQAESLARVLGECGTGTDISRIFSEKSISDDSGESTKWRRLYWHFRTSQERHGTPNHILSFTQAFLNPHRFVGRLDEFESHRGKVNEILIFSGIQLEKSGDFIYCEKASTLDEAERRVSSIRQKFRGRSIHQEALKYCVKELMQENYFHAVFEASKGLAQRLRDMSGIQADGAALVERVFSVDKPILAFNFLQTETEKSEHKGFAALIKGCFGAIRNPLAHEPKILWDGEDDAADYLTLISMLHRKLDNCFPTKL